MNKNYYLKYIKYKTKYLYEKESLRGGEPKKKIILFSVSANPTTFSHIEIIVELSKNYDHVVVWITTNPNKINPAHKDYDPFYLSLEERISMFKPCLDELKLSNVVFDQIYNDYYSGVSICKYIGYNLLRNHDLDGLSFGEITLPFKQFSVRPDKRDKLENTQYELWICFGKDVVADLSNWTYNNLFLTLATGIIMKNRNDEKNYRDERYSFFSRHVNSTITKDNSTFFAMPCIKKKLFTKDKILENLDKNCYQANQQFISDIDYSNDGPLCIIEIKQFSNSKNYSSTSVRNLMMAYYLLEGEEEKKNIYLKLLNMVPESVLSMMIRFNFYAIPITDEKVIILKSLGLHRDATNEQITCKIYEIEQQNLI